MTGNLEAATPKYGGAAADLQICLRFLAAEAKRETASGSVLLAAKGEARQSLGEADFPDSMLEESPVTPGDVIPLTWHRHGFLMSPVISLPKATAQSVCCHLHRDRRTLCHLSPNHPNTGVKRPQASFTGSL